MLPLDGSVRLTTQLSGDTGGTSDDLRVEIHSRGPNGGWRRHAVARVRAASDAGPVRAPAAADGGTALSPADFYSALQRTGLQHGPAFAALTRIVRKPAGVADDRDRAAR